MNVSKVTELVGSRALLFPPYHTPIEHGPHSRESADNMEMSVTQRESDWVDSKLQLSEKELKAYS